jgi:hypothetical protein
MKKRMVSRKIDVAAMYLLEYFPRILDFKYYYWAGQKEIESHSAG